jgi:hypothetical protein
MYESRTVTHRPHLLLMHLLIIMACSSQAMTCYGTPPCLCATVICYPAQPVSILTGRFQPLSLCNTSFVYFTVFHFVRHQLTLPSAFNVHANTGLPQKKDLSAERLLEKLTGHTTEKPSQLFQYLHKDENSHLLVLAKEFLLQGKIRTNLSNLHKSKKAERIMHMSDLIQPLVVARGEGIPTLEVQNLMKAYGEQAACLANLTMQAMTAVQWTRHAWPAGIANLSLCGLFAHACTASLAFSGPIIPD